MGEIRRKMAGSKSWDPRRKFMTGRVVHNFTYLELIGLLNKKLSVLHCSSLRGETALILKMPSI